MQGASMQNDIVTKHMTRRFFRQLEFKGESKQIGVKRKQRTETKIKVYRPSKFTFICCGKIGPLLFDCYKRNNQTARMLTLPNRRARARKKKCMLTGRRCSLNRNICARLALHRSSRGRVNNQEFPGIF